MILCDIGNSFYHFYDRGKVWKSSVKDSVAIDKNETLFTASVNDKALDKLRKIKPDLIDLADYIDFNSSYAGLGIDRALACLAVQDGVVVDAGSAITIDIMACGMHLGGFIMPGIASMQKAFALSAPVLDKPFNFGINLDALPQNTVDAVSFGGVGAIVFMIKNAAKGKKIYFTGGDGAYLSRFFEDSAVDELLVFKGMQSVIAVNRLI